MLSNDKHEEAEIMMEKAFELKKKIKEIESTQNEIEDEEDLLQESNEYLMLAYIKAALKKFDEAFEIYVKYLPIQEKYSPNTIQLASNKINFADVLSEKEQYEDALKESKSALNILKKLRLENELVAGAMENISGYLCALKKYNEAKHYAKEAYLLFLKVKGKKNENTKFAFTNYYAILMELGHVDEAKDVETDFKAQHAEDDGNINIPEEVLKQKRREFEEKLGIKDEPTKKKKINTKNEIRNIIEELEQSKRGGGSKNIDDTIKHFNDIDMALKMADKKMLNTLKKEMIELRRVKTRKRKKKSK